MYKIIVNICKSLFYKQKKKGEQNRINYKEAYLKKYFINDTYPGCNSKY